MCSGDGDVPLYLRVADGNESDRAVFANLIRDFKQEWNIDALFIADAALYSAENIQQLQSLRWLSRVPGTIKEAQNLLTLPDELFVSSSLEGYKSAEVGSYYAGIKQRCLVVESEQARKSDLKKIEKQLANNLAQAKSQLKALCRPEFACEPDAEKAVQLLAHQLQFFQLDNVKIQEQVRHGKSGRPSQNQKPTKYYYRIEADLIPISVLERSLVLHQ